MGRCHITVALQQSRRYPITMTTIGGLGTTAAPSLNRPARFFHQSSYLDATHAIPLGLKGFDQATTAITVRGLF
jgi:hypothetical protein